MKLKIIYYFLILTLFPVIALAEKKRAGIGGMAKNLMEPVSVVSDFVHSGCLVIGMGFIFASIVKYFEHRRSPLMVPISTVIFLLIAGIILVLMPFLSMLTSNGVPYVFFK